MNKTWKRKKSAKEEEVHRNMSELHLTRPLAELLAQRGINHLDAAKTFFRPMLEDLHDPFLMKDMDVAVDRLQHAINKGEKILVYGDYDVDGTTAVTMVYSFLRKLQLDCDFYIPDRYTEGYGFSNGGVDYAKENGMTLIITLDCGIKDLDRVKYAKSLGIDVIICDHHNPGDLPDAAAVLNPKRQDCNYPFDGLSGCGVGFKLLQAWCIKHGHPLNVLYEYLDLLTISIGADIVPIVDENRVLAFYGLQRIALRKRPGIEAMLFQASFKKPVLSITDVVFVLAPRINAAGRIYSGEQAVHLLLSETMEDALKLSPALEENNNQRKNLDKEITIEAVAMAAAFDDHQESFATVVYSEKWHKGVVGIVASRLVETFYKPAIVMVKDGDKLTGSARSVEGLDLFDALNNCAVYLEKFGGHTMAAGLTLSEKNFPAFRDSFNNSVRDMLKGQMPVQEIEYDLEISFEDIDEKFYRILKQFGPFGPGNMSPVFLVKNVVNARYSRAVGEAGSHLKLHVKEKNQKKTFDGIGFHLGKWADYLLADGEVDILFSVEENEYQGRVSLQLVLKDIRKNDSQAKVVNPENF
jgi:single-stranded-DNA-specific exonuclease